MFEDLRKFFREMFGSKISFFVDLAWFSRIYGRTDVKISFLVKFCFRWTYPEVCTCKKPRIRNFCRPSNFFHQLGGTQNRRGIKSLASFPNKTELFIQIARKISNGRKIARIAPIWTKIWQNRSQRLKLSFEKVFRATRAQKKRFGAVWIKCPDWSWWNTCSQPRSSQACSRIRRHFFFFRITTHKPIIRF